MSLIYIEFLEVAAFSAKSSEYLGPALQISILAAKFLPEWKFFLDFLVDIPSLWRHLRHSQEAFNGRLVYARV